MKTRKKVIPRFLDRVDLVDTGDNPHAHIALYKRQQDGPGSPGEEEGVDPKELRKNLGLPEDATDEQVLAKGKELAEAAAAKPEDKTAELQKQLDAEKEAREKAEEELKKAQASDEPEDELKKALKDLPENIAKAVETQTEALKKQAEEAERIAKEERDKRETAEFIQKAKSFGPIGKAEELGLLMKNASEKLDEEEYKKFEATLRAASEQVAAGNLFKEFGTVTEEEKSAKDQLETMAKKIASEDDVPYEVAYAKALDSEDGQKLYEQVRGV